MWAARVPWTAAARYAAGACAASLAAPPPTDCDAVRRRLTPIGRFALLSETRDAPSVPAVLLELGGAPLAARDLERGDPLAVDDVRELAEEPDAREQEHGP